MPTLSVVVPVRAGAGVPKRCLEGLCHASPPPDEIVVVVDGPDEAARAALTLYAALVPVRAVVLPAARGPAHARNVGACLAKGEVVFFVDADVVVAPNAVGLVARHFARPGAPAAVIGSYDDAPGDPGFLSQYRNLLHHHTHQTARHEAATFWGACGAVRRAAFLAVGGFDERRFATPSVEDIELGYRLRRAGHRIRLAPALQSKHLKRWTPAGLLATDVFRRAAPWARLLLQYRRLDDDLNLRTGSRISVVASVLLLASLVLALSAPVWLGAAAALGAGLWLLNRDFYRFLAQRRGGRFAARAFPWHVGYYLCAAAGACMGGVQHLVARGGRRGAHRPLQRILEPSLVLKQAALSPEAAPAAQAA